MILKQCLTQNIQIYDKVKMKSEFKKKKIAFIVNNSAFFVSHRLVIAEKLIKEGVGVKVFFGQGGSKVMEKNSLKTLRNKKIKYKKIAFSNSIKNIFVEIYGFIQLLHELKKFNPDLIHSISPKGNLFGIISFRILNIQSIVVAFSGMGTLFIGEGGIIKKIYRKIFIILFRASNKKGRHAIIVQNKNDMFFVKNNLHINIKNIYLIKGSGVRVKRYLSDIKKKKKIIMLPSRMIEEKGVKEFVEAAKILKKKFKDWKFLLVGAADYDNPTAINKEDLLKWSKNKDIEWKDYVIDMEKLYKKTSIVCLPSYREGMPKCLLEAAAASCAVVTTNVVGCKEAIIPGKTGELAKVRNVEDLKNKLQLLMTARKKRETYGINGRNLAIEMYDVQNVVDKSLNIYHKLIAR